MATPVNPAPEPMLTIRPVPASSMDGNAERAQANWLVKFEAIVSSHCS